DVAPHVGAFCGLPIERRIHGPALRLEDRAEQEWPPAHTYPGLCGERRNAHGRRIGIRRRKLEPEVENRRHDRTSNSERRENLGWQRSTYCDNWELPPDFRTARSERIAQISRLRRIPAGSR